MQSLRSLSACCGSRQRTGPDLLWPRLPPSPRHASLPSSVRCSAMQLPWPPASPSSAPRPLRPRAPWQPRTQTPRGSTPTPRASARELPRWSRPPRSLSRTPFPGPRTAWTSLRASSRWLTTLAPSRCASRPCTLRRRRRALAARRPSCAMRAARRAPRTQRQARGAANSTPRLASPAQSFSRSRRPRGRARPLQRELGRSLLQATKAAQ